MKCPFCLNHKIEAKPGKTTCPECSAEFEIDDRLESIFADTQKMRLTVNGMVCGVCVGLCRAMKIGIACIVGQIYAQKFNKKSSNKGLKIGYMQ